MRPSLSELVERCRRLVDGGGRILGIAGPPGAGKSTLAAALAEAWGPAAQVLPMDGFHLADDELARLGRAHRKGAPDTFDLHGYLTALQRVRRRDVDVIVPRFDRSLEAAIAGSLRIGVGTDLVITEGNYLLLDRPGWSDVRGLLDEVWYVDVDDAERTAQLLDRHVAHGRSADDAAAWVHEVDQPNAVLVAAGRSAADLVVRR